MSEQMTTSGVDSTTSGVGQIEAIVTEATTSGVVNGAGAKNPAEPSPAYLKVLGEKKNAKAALDTANAEIKALKEEKLLEEGKWKEVAEARGKEVDELKQKDSAREVRDVELAKQALLRRELLKSGVDANLVERVERTIDMSNVTIDGETNVALGLDAELESLRKDLPQLFTKPRVGVNNNAPLTTGGVIGQLTPQQIAKLPEAERIRVLLERAQQNQ